MTQYELELDYAYWQELLDDTNDRLDNVTDENERKVLLEAAEEYESILTELQAKIFRGIYKSIHKKDT